MSSLAVLRLIVALGLALFAVALALPRPAHPIGRGTLLGLLTVLGGLVLRAVLVEAGLWSVGAAELAIVLGAFLGVPVLAAAYGREQLGARGVPWQAWAALAGFTIGLGVLLVRRGAPILSPAEWQVYVGLLYVTGLASAVWLGRAWRRTSGSTEVRGTVALFAIHWAFSTASWTVSVFGGGSAGLARVFEVGSLVSLLGFGAVAVVRALHSLPAFQPPAAVPYAASGLDTSLCRQRAEALRRHMQTAKPHLNPELGAADLADALGLTGRELSQVLSVEIGQGFFEFVNAHRTEEAKRLLASPEAAQATVLEILYASGFNSKSAFHRAFKANVGVTPSAYRRRQLDAYAQAA